jgi:hypothetical protein
MRKKKQMEITNDTVPFDQYLTIISFCRNTNIDEYKINDDGSIDIFNIHPLKILNTFMDDLPVKINNITGDFTLGYNYKLSSLKNCPKYIGGNVWIIKNTNLPSVVQGFLNEYRYNTDKIKTFLRYQNDVELDNLYYPDLYILPLTIEGEQRREYLYEYHHDPNGNLIHQSIHRYGAYEYNFNYMGEIYLAILVNND